MNAPVVFQPADEQEWLALRAHYVTSTEVAALFGVSPYEGTLSLFLRKQAADPGEHHDNERMFWGRELESAIAHGAAKRMGWRIQKLDAFMGDPDDEPAHLGASFDFETGDGALLEIKSVDRAVWRQKWIESTDGTIQEAPPWIELQVQAQMAVAQRDRAYLAVLVGGNELRVGERPRNDAVIAAIRARAAQFWRELRAGLLPNPDYDRDQDAIAHLAPDPGLTADLQCDVHFTSLVRQYQAAKRQARDADQAAARLRAEIEYRMGEAHQALIPGGRVIRRVVPETPVTYLRKSYRDFRIFGGSNDPSE